VSGIAKARAQERSTSSESRGSDGRTRTVTTHVYELSFKGADEQELWSASESHLIGARYDRLAAEVEELASGERAVELVRLHAIWPVLLAGSLFVTLAVSVLGTKLGMALRDRGLIPEAVFRPVFYWGPLLVPVALFGWAWLVSLLGKDPPRVVAALLAALS
jgi:hypothetical protein